MATAQTAQTYQDAANANLMARNYLLRNSPLITRPIGVTSGYGLGSTMRIKLQNYGLLTSVLVKFECQVDIGTASAVLSDKGPYNLVKRIRLSDYSGKTRVDLSGEMLFAINSVRRGTYYGYNNESASQVLNSPLTPTSVGTAQSLTFFLEIPVAFDELRDLRGIISMMTGNGDMYLTVDYNSALVTNGNADSVYKGAPTSTVILTAGYAPQINATVYQRYYLPPSVNGQSVWPALDAQCVYELSQWFTSDNLNANAEKLIAYPVGRSVLAAYVWFINNGVCNPSATDVGRLRQIFNGSEVAYESDAAAFMFNMRLMLNSDIRNGLLIFPSRTNPIDPQTFGNVQIGFTPTSVVNTTYPARLDVAWESMYNAGAVLSSVNT